jgi:DNA ligase (NAD+)
MDIRGLGAERIRQLLEAGLVKDVSDLYRVTPAQLVQLERFAKLSAEQLVRAIEDSKARPLSCLLFGLGVRHVGKTVAVLLARHFGTMERLAASDQEAISAVPGVGPAIAEAVTDWFGNRDNRNLVTRLGALGLQFSEPDAVEQDGVLNGKTYVLTGSMETMTRDEARHHIERAGGRVVGGVTGRTDTLVAGRDPGSKLDAAKQRGIEIIDEAELRRRLGLILTTDDGAR